MEASKTLIIQNKLGLHARAATKLAELSMNFESDIYIHCNDKKANANSVMGLLMLSGAKGKEILVSCHGNDAGPALAAVETLISSRFEEKE